MGVRVRVWARGECEGVNVKVVCLRAWMWGVQVWV